ncbi:MAG: hypothetical protein HQM02_07195 [Magnetococcales bacterium]|nr:hypothetical protein [Magnetococcales bacterium]
MKFIDPRIDFAFKKIFGSEDAKDIRPAGSATVSMIAAMLTSRFQRDWQRAG